MIFLKVLKVLKVLKAFNDFFWGGWLSVGKIKARSPFGDLALW